MANRITEMANKINVANPKHSLGMALMMVMVMMYLGQRENCILKWISVFSLQCQAHY